MKNAVIICEFNPLHIGHKRLLDSARAAGAENVICVMSGSAVQRGELACLDKYTRAEHAVRAGADVVIELPAEYTLSAAKQFALGGVKIANEIKDATLVFGSECGDLGTLERLSSLMKDPQVNEKIKNALASGIGYPAALASATGESALTNNPNNTLGIEYLNAINYTGRKICAYTVKRENSPTEQAPLGFPTSSSIREKARTGDEISDLLLPDYVLKNLNGHPLNDDKLFAVIKYSLCSYAKSGIYDDAEGLINRLSDVAEKTDTFDEFCLRAATKRYTRARVRRLALNAVLNNTFTHTELTEKPVNFVNLLAVAKGKEDVLSEICVPVAVSRRTRAPYADDFALTSRTDKLFSAVRYPFDETTRFV